MRILKLAALYFAWVFASGFALGTVRTLWIVPRLGDQLAESIEAPVMLAISAFVARTIVRRHAELRRSTEWLGVGMLALAMMLLVELTVVLRLRGLSVEAYFATRDPVSGSVYYASLALFAILPTVVFHWRRIRHPRAIGNTPRR
jgi:hypothetical protein